MALLASLAQIRVRADAGDKRAKKQVKKLTRQLAKLAKQAKRGNAAAARRYRVLNESGLFAPSQVFAMNGPCSCR